MNTLTKLFPESPMAVKSSLKFVLWNAALLPLLYYSCPYNIDVSVICHMLFVAPYINISFKKATAALEAW
jgi:hypothetical protein